MGPDYCYFKVKGEDGNLYILRMDMGRAEWELTDNVISIRRLLDETTALSPFWIPRVRFMAEFIERECRPLALFARSWRSRELPAMRSESRHSP